MTVEKLIKVSLQLFWDAQLQIVLAFCLIVSGFKFETRLQVDVCLEHCLQSAKVETSFKMIPEIGIDFGKLDDNFESNMV
jgi:hypothetical protein